MTLINTTEQGESSCEPSSIVKDHEEPQTDLATRREFLKIQIMEKIWSFVEKPEDVPRAVEAGRQICLQLQGIEKGSLLFKMKVSSLDDLERLRDLVRYGGMKKILDQEVIHKNMKVRVQANTDLNFAGTALGKVDVEDDPMESLIFPI